MLVFLGFMGQFAYSQHIKIISATSQGWAEGVCCRAGITYTIELKIIPGKSRIVLDSLWMEGNCVDLSSYHQKKHSKFDTLNISIREGVGWDDGIPLENWCFNASKKGVTITYYQDHRKKTLVITPYIKELEFLAYP